MDANSYKYLNACMKEIEICITKKPIHSECIDARSKTKDIEVKLFYGIGINPKKDAYDFHDKIVAIRKHNYGKY
jgi:hypothetical protein